MVIYWYVPVNELYFTAVVKGRMLSIKAWSLNNSISNSIISKVFTIMNNDIDNVNYVKKTLASVTVGSTATLYSWHCPLQPCSSGSTSTSRDAL